MKPKPRAPALICWELLAEPDTRQILEWCEANEGVDRLIAVIRPTTDRTGAGHVSEEALRTTEELFSGRTIDRRWCSAWPGTELVRHQAIVFVVSFDSGLRDRMAELGPGLYDWTHWDKPKLPEDLCLYREGARWPALVTVTHERQAWIFTEGGVEPPASRRTELRPADILVPPFQEGSFWRP